MKKLRLTAAILATACLPTSARAETSYLECPGTNYSVPETAWVTIDFAARTVAVVNGAYRWQTRVAVSESQLSWETESPKGTNYWVINRYSGEMWVRGPGFSLVYNCRKLDRPPQRRM